MKQENQPNVEQLLPRGERPTEKQKYFYIKRCRLIDNPLVVVEQKNGKTYRYKHNEVYMALRERFEAMESFQEHGRYCQIYVPAFVRELGEDYVELIEDKQA